MVGYVDDLLRVPIGLLLTLRLKRVDVVAESRELARVAWEDGELTVRRGALLAVAVRGLGLAYWRLSPGGCSRPEHRGPPPWVAGAATGEALLGPETGTGSRHPDPV